MIICNYKQCTGCGACVAICPTKAIIATENEEGFLVPQINDKYCISCQKCKDVCPLNGGFNVKNDHHCYAFKATDDIREKVSSGGAFYVLAYYVINVLAGYVCGAAWDNGMRVKHRIVHSIDQLDQSMFRVKHIAYMVTLEIC